MYKYKAPMYEYKVLVYTRMYELTTKNHLLEALRSEQTTQYIETEQCTGTVQSVHCSVR